MKHKCKCHLLESTLNFFSKVCDLGQTTARFSLLNKERKLAWLVVVPYNTACNGTNLEKMGSYSFQEHVTRPSNLYISFSDSWQKVFLEYRKKSEIFCILFFWILLSPYYLVSLSRSCTDPLMSIENNLKSSSNNFLNNQQSTLQSFINIWMYSQAINKFMRLSGSSWERSSSSEFIFISR